MTVTNEPIVPGSPVTFKVTGFPEETAIRQSIERFYSIKRDAERIFNVLNSFGEQIFSGTLDAEGRVLQFVSFSPSGKQYADKLDSGHSN